MITKKNLIDGLKRAATVKGKSDIPVINNTVKAEVTKGGRVYIHATDLNSHVRILVGDVLQCDCNILVDAKNLMAVVKIQPAGALDINIAPTVIRIGEHFSVEARRQLVEDFPTHVFDDCDFDHVESSFVSALKSLYPLAKSMAEHENLQCVLWEGNTLVSTNGHTVTRVRINVYVGDRVLIPQLSVKHIKSIFDTKTLLYYRIHDNILYLRQRAIDYNTILHVGAYPDAASLFKSAESNSIYTITLNRQSILDILSLIPKSKCGNVLSVISLTDNSITTERDTLKLPVLSSAGDMAKVGRVGINAKYLHDAIKNQTSENTSLSFVSPDAAIYVSGTERSAESLIMPMRIPGNG